MFRILWVIIVIVGGSAAVLGQAAADAQALNHKIADLFNQGKLDDAVPMAEELVKLQRRGGAARQKGLVSALENLAQIKLTRFKRTSVELSSSVSQGDAAKKLSGLMVSDAKDIEEHLRDALLLSKTASVSTEQNVSIRNSLGWILYKYSPPIPRPVVEYDKASRDRLEMQTRAAFYKRADEAAGFYAEALKIAEGDADYSPDPLIMALYNLADYKAAVSDLESALIHYEKVVSLIRAKHGKYAKTLLGPLESYATALAATHQDGPASDAVSLMVRVSGKSMPYPKGLLNLSHRTEKSFAPYLGPSAEKASGNTKETADLAGRRVVTNISAAGGDVTGISIAASTLTRDYYDYAGRISVKKFVVRVAVDETGAVTEAEALTAAGENKAAAEKIVREWKFRPFSAGGKAGKMSGYVECRLMLDHE